jgi:hypothetical protein
MKMRKGNPSQLGVVLYMAAIRAQRNLTRSCQISATEIDGESCNGSPVLFASQRSMEEREPVRAQISTVLWTLRVASISSNQGFDRNYNTWFGSFLLGHIRLFFTSYDNENH